MLPHMVLVVSLVTERTLMRPLWNWTQEKLLQQNGTMPKSVKSFMSLVCSEVPLPYYFYGLPFIIASDHKPLLRRSASTWQTYKILSPCIFWWAVFLIVYYYTIQKRPAKGMSSCWCPELPVFQIHCQFNPSYGAADLELLPEPFMASILLLFQYWLWLCSLYLSPSVLLFNIIKVSLLNIATISSKDQIPTCIFNCVGTGEPLLINKIYNPLFCPHQGYLAG